MPVQDMVLRLVKGSPLTDLEGDDNFRNLRDFCNALEALVGVSLNPDGTFKAGSINNVNQFSTAILDALMFRPGDIRSTFNIEAARTGWLACDGSAVNRITYADLFAAIATTYGPGDGVTTFNLPDARGRTIIGDGPGPGLTARTQGQAMGEESHKLNLPEMAHYHGTATDFFLDDPPVMTKRPWDISTQTPNSIITRGNDLTGGGGIGDGPAEASGVLGTTNPVADADADPTLHNNMQPSLVAKVWIKI